jgi:hypothetical protein
MNNDLIERINDDLKRYEEVIEETDKNFDSLKILGRYAPCAPYLFKYNIIFLIMYTEKKGFDLSEIKKKYEKINKKLVSFEQKRGKTYRDKVYEELKYLVDTYYSTICHFLKSDPIDMETENDMMGRDDIEILIEEFNTDYNIKDMKVKISALDEVLKCKFKTDYELLMKECPNIEKPYYPESFWWRHPSKFRTINK